MIQSISESRIIPILKKLQPLVDAYITPERLRRYLTSLSNAAAPSTAASAIRNSILKEHLRADGALRSDYLHFHDNFGNTGSTAILTGSRDSQKPLWYFAHLDTLSYLVLPRQGSHYPLVPFCHHLVRDGSRQAAVYRFDLSKGDYLIVAKGRLESEDQRPFFKPENSSLQLKPGDRVVLSAEYQEDPVSGDFSAHIDNAGAVAALATAAPVLALAKIDALLAFPDEEEGPVGSGNQVMGRGSTRIANLLPVPDLVIVSDVQQAGGGAQADTRDGIENSTRLGNGAVLAEFSSFARGAVTPPHLYALAVSFAETLREFGVKIQESNNAYTSRSDDVSALLKTPNVLLLGFAGFNRHFDLGTPKANLHDLVSLAKALVYFTALRFELGWTQDKFTRK
jgi:putative aminopeptidase FrvX